MELRPTVSIRPGQGLHPSIVGCAPPGKALAFRGAVHPLARFVLLPAGPDGQMTASGAQSRLRCPIGSESPETRMSDEELAAALRAEGVDIARRTVAKYTDRLAIPSSTRRRRRRHGEGAGNPEPR